MRIILKSTCFFVLIVSMILLTGCESDDNNKYIEGTNSVYKYLEKDTDYSLFLRAIDESGMRRQLNGNAGILTVFAPNNHAFQEYLNENGIEDFNEIPESELLRLVNYHILESITPEENFNTGYIPTKALIAINDSVDAHLSLFVDRNIDGLKFNGKVKITESDIQLDNGIMHKVDKTLALPTLKTFMEADNNLIPFFERITASGITTDFENILADPNGRNTMLVPAKNAVESFFAGSGAQMSPLELNEMYRYHLLDTLKNSHSFRNEYLKTRARESYSGQQQLLNLYVNVSGVTTFNDGTALIIPDLTTINGNIQVIDSVLSLPTTGTFVRADSRYTLFADMLGHEDQVAQGYFNLLDEGISGSNTPLTIFAPDNSAFSALSGELYPEQGIPLDSLPTDEMTQVLNLHIAKNLSLRSEDFTQQNINTLGGNIQLFPADTSYLIDMRGKQSLILETNRQAANGILHQLNKVLLPEE